MGSHFEWHKADHKGDNSEIRRVDSKTVGAPDNGSPLIEQLLLNVKIYKKQLLSKFNESHSLAS